MQQSGTRDDLVAIAYGNGQFVAVGNVCDSDPCVSTILTSADGVNWAQRQSGTQTQSYMSRITYGNGQFVAVSGDSDIIVTSADGANWEKRRSGTHRHLGYAPGALPPAKFQPPSGLVARTGW